MSTKFDILKAQVNGLTRMNTKPKDYQTQVNDFIEDQIDMGIKSFAVMDDLDKDRLCTLMTQALGKDISYAIIEMDDLDAITHELLKYINNNSMLSAYDLAESLRQSLYLRFEYAADEIFDVLKEARWHAEREGRGLKQHVDPINGEVSYKL